MVSNIPADSHYMQLPREVLIGQKVAPLVGETLVRLGVHGNALIVTGPKVKGIAAATVIESLEEAKFATSTIVVNGATTDQVQQVEQEIHRFKPNIIIGIGGGKDIDVAKLSSIHTSKQFLSVPTAASHDGIASPLISMKGLDRPYSYIAHAPMAIVADTSIIGKSPYRLIASGCGDIVAKYTAVRDWKLAHRIKNEYYGDYAAELAIMSSRLVMKNASGIRMLSNSGVRTLVEALISCGVAMSIAGTSRPCSGAEHLFSHCLTMIAPTPALHGEQCGVGTILCAYLHGANWQLIKDVLHTIGAPTTAKELGISSQHILEALTKAHSIRPERYTILGESGLTKEAAERVASITGVI
ncbi:MAG: NAD(P)-dependent glycerol-1-phosphate dehydrogenase [Candidatus Bathyarchaeia archaeon]|jgi:glycerol-1-phosphate dehydrogenase [NAD(P)+]